MTLYFSANPDPINLIKGSLILFWFLTSAGILLILVGYYQHRRYKFSYSNLAVILAGGIFIILAYYGNWIQFYVLTAKNDKIYLQYFFPKRIQEFATRDIKLLRKNYSGRMSYNLFIETRDGKEYTSAAMNVSQLDRNEKKLKDFLEKQLGYTRGGK